MVNLTYKQTEKLLKLIGLELSFLEDNKARWKKGYNCGDWKGLTENEVKQTIQNHEDDIEMLEDIITQLKQ